MGLIKQVYNAARANLKRGIKEAKLAYKAKIKEYFNVNNILNFYLFFHFYLSVFGFVLCHRVF